MSGSETLADWLRRQLDLDAEIAQAAEAVNASPWTARYGLVVGGVDPDSKHLDGALWDNEGAGSLAMDERVSPHVARHDPARVLRDVAAKRAVLDLHALDVVEIRQARFNEFSGRPMEAEYEVTCAVCGWATFDPTSACRTVLLLAQTHRGEPGWREEWDIDD